MTSHALYVAEPPLAYRVYPPVVVDCSVLMSLIFYEPQRSQAIGLIERRSLHAPYSLDFEVASVALKKSARGATQTDVDQALLDYVNYKVKLHRTQLTGQLELAKTYRLSAYDAAYLWLAAELKVPLVTFDLRLADAARDHLSKLT